MVQELLDLSTGKVWRRTLPDGEWSTNLVDNGPYVRAPSESSRIVTGTKVVNFAGTDGVAVLFNESQMESLIGRWFNTNRDCISLMNGDGTAVAKISFLAIYDGTARVIRALAVGKTALNGSARVNYTIVTG